MKSQEHPSVLQSLSREPGPTRIAWFEDNPEHVSSAINRLDSLGFSVQLLPDTHGMRNYITDTVRDRKAPVPDVCITDLRVDNQTYDDDGVKLAEYIRGCYETNLYGPPRIGIASAYPGEIQQAMEQNSVRFAFAYEREDIIDGYFETFVAEVRLSRARFWRDVWCNAHNRANPILSHRQNEGFSISAVCYGVLSHIDRSSAIVEVWNPLQVGSERRLHFDSTKLAEMGICKHQQPVRLFEQCDLKDKRNINPGLYIEAIGNATEFKFVPLRTDIDFTKYEKKKEIKPTTRKHIQRRARR